MIGLSGLRFYNNILLLYIVGNVLEAAVAAESYLLLIPNDPIMMANLGYYKKQPSVMKKIIKPRPVCIYINSCWR